MSNGAEAEFWKWFVRNEEELYLHSSEHLEARENLFDRVLAELHKVNADLAFEFSGPQAVREFIITAQGIRDSFPAVLRLQETAPPLPRWEVIAFRPRRDPIGTISMGNLELNSRDFLYTLLTREKEIGLRLFIPSYREEDTRFKSIAYLFLDEALGELEMETRIGLLTFHPLEDESEYERHPFKELPTHFDRLYNHLHGYSGKPE